MRQLMMILFAVVFSSGLAFAQNNSGSVNQTGNDNDAELTQNGTHEATITQVGDMNDATVLQQGSDTESLVNVTQTGNDNDATALYLGRSGDWSGSNIGEITQIQTGDDNTAYAVGRESANLRQEQVGNNNNAQIGDPTGESGSPNGIRRVMSVDQYQEGDFNTAYVEPVFRFIRDGNISQSQVGDENRAEALGLTNAARIDQSQVGDYNISVVEQGNSNFHAYTTQEGNWNEAYITTGGHSHNEIIQLGDDNWGSIQTSSGGYGFISQDGDFNTATITQNN